jgi:hypothetical protein
LPSRPKELRLDIGKIEASGANSMTLQLALSFHRSARVWLDELPEVSFFSFEQSFEHAIPANPSVLKYRQAAVELLAPKGSLAMYGLLGAELIPDSNGKLRVRVGIGTNKNAVYSSPLVLASEKVSVGLEREFAGGVLEVVANEIQQQSVIPSGELIFSWAVQGAVGSSRVLFKQLGSYVSKLILLEEREPSVNDLTTLFNSLS